MAGIETITEYRIPADKAEIKEENDTYILRVEDEDVVNEQHTVKQMPDVVQCPSCEIQTARQVEDGEQLFKCEDCGRETVRMK